MFNSFLPSMAARILKNEKMKKTIIFCTLLISTITFSQVAIGKEAQHPKGLLDFGNDSNKGIILPIAEISPRIVYENGTLLVDKEDKKIKVYQNQKWLDLTDVGSFIVERDSNGNALTTAVALNPSEEIEDNEGVTIGIPLNTIKTEGVLVLESTDKALILPKVANPHTSIKSPVAGTICYDTVSNSMAIFDGKVWSYWK